MIDFAMRPVLYRQAAHTAAAFLQPDQSPQQQPRVGPRDAAQAVVPEPGPAAHWTCRLASGSPQARHVDRTGICQPPTWALSGSLQLRHMPRPSLVQTTSASDASCSGSHSAPYATLVQFGQWTRNDPMLRCCACWPASEVVTGLSMACRSGRSGTATDIGRAVR